MEMWHRKCNDEYSSTSFSGHLVFPSQEEYLSLATNTLELSLTSILILIHDVHFNGMCMNSFW